MIFTYAVLFSGDSAVLLKGSGTAETHDMLLKRHTLLARFDECPSDFIMGRLRLFDKLEIVLVDTASDLYWGKTGIDRPLNKLTPERYRLWKLHLLKAIPSDWKLWFLDGGMALRVPGVSEPRFKRLLRDAGSPGRPLQLLSGQPSLR